MIVRLFLRALTRLPLLVRIWWHSPANVDRVLVAVALETTNDQFDRAASAGAAAIAARRWRESALFGTYRRDAFDVECDEDRTRTFLTEELFGGRRRRGRDLTTVVTELADRALLGMPCFVEIRFDEREGTTHFVELAFLQPRSVRRHGDQYLIAPASGSGQPRVVDRMRMLDAEVDLPIGLEAPQRAELIEAFVDGRILDHARSNTLDAHLFQERRGLRWDAARLRRIDRKATDF
ncbi:MAG TPA: hypothetical protein DCK98_01980 [Chloroflexi bacterium]|jgi:hypothetical protein|nr:hypothetical protein [Chloroflexota bacterium]HAL25858.1 hypothetical protein [Chloroflexota bacterium]